MTLQILSSIGHASTNDPNQVENIAVAGLGHEASISTPDHAVQEVIDRGQQLESNVAAESGVLRGHATIRIPHVTSSVSHVWTQFETREQQLEHVAIPWLEEKVANSYAGNR